jgi:hypothetical protein
MDRKTKEILKRLEQMRKFPWKSGTRVCNMDVHLLIGTLYGLTKRLGLGTVFLDRERQMKRLSRLEATRREIEFREDVDCFLARVEEASGKLGEVIDGIMLSFGYHRPYRQCWRVKCESRVFQEFRDTVNTMKNTKSSSPTLPIPPGPPSEEAEVRKLFARARKGDDDALKQVQEMVRDRNWADFLGDLGQECTLVLLERATSGDPVRKVGILQKVQNFMAELLGDNLTVLDKLLARQVVNDWIAFYTLELEAAANKTEPVPRLEYLDKALSRAHRRYLQSLRELAHVQKLQSGFLKRALRHPGRAEVHTLINPVGREDTNGDG